MDSAIITAGAIILGALVGAATNVGTTWITQRTQSVRSRVEARLRDREALYGEFITEASRLTAEALTHQLEQPASFVNLYAILGRIRLVADDAVLAAAEASGRRIVELFEKPNMSMDQIRAAFEGGQVDPIKEFSTACRAELHQIAQLY